MRGRRPEPMTGVQKQIMAEIQKRGGEIRSFLRLVDDLGIDYDNAWRMLSRLETAGLVIVIRRKGQPLVVFANPCTEIIPDTRPAYAPACASRGSVFENSAETGNRIQQGVLWTV